MASWSEVKEEIYTYDIYTWFAQTVAMASFCEWDIYTPQPSLVWVAGAS